MRGVVLLPSALNSKLLQILVNINFREWKDEAEAARTEMGTQVSLSEVPEARNRTIIHAVTKL